MQASESLVRPGFNGTGPDGYRRAPATMNEGFYALDPEPWGAPFLPTAECVAVFPGGRLSAIPTETGSSLPQGPETRSFSIPTTRQTCCPNSKGTT